MINITEAVMEDIMGPGTINPDVMPEGPTGNRGGHNVYDNDYIFPHSSLKCNRWRSFTTIYFPGSLPPQTFPRAIV